eukprot:CAMPEP_0175054834 /NCGR_PEP_ID=MMETSP0052_2-20121109/9726_1 /TAXON_ID=51329 ORGANISM="Polytomella parva, Strain SAG 63-3" /NCGR_SAMPLE_ID=MMETSP0052_2 /ASSEMBLY_ACC=CAM_ASM_000194 /LENGTH=579 /DNA_ID=CAMNT_0016319575 /DNA_START=167 /DNA_END=1902 /DNA_ORIENTATION=+
MDDSSINKASVSPFAFPNKQIDFLSPFPVNSVEDSSIRPSLSKEAPQLSVTSHEDNSVHRKKNLSRVGTVSIRHLSHQSSMGAPSEEEEEEKQQYSKLPWYLKLKKFRIDPDARWWLSWWHFTVVMSLVSGWTEPFAMAFMPDHEYGSYSNFWGSLNLVIVIVFLVDMTMKFLVKYEDLDTGEVYTELFKIARHYIIKDRFVLDVLSSMPFSSVTIAVAHSCGVSATTLHYCGLLKLLTILRLYRAFEFFSFLDFHMLVSQGVLLMLRNYTYAIFATHWAACVFYLIARLEMFNENTWVGRNADRFDGQSIIVKYALSWYFSVGVLAGLGDGALFATTVAECVFVTVYMLLNLVLAAYILGTVTMLVVKSDERSSTYRDKMVKLSNFTSENEIPRALESSMKEHLEVHFHCEQENDEEILAIYPTTIRRRVLRHLYLKPVKSCYLFRGCKQKFLEAVLVASRVELFMPGVNVMGEGDVVTELNILVSGEVMSTSSESRNALQNGQNLGAGNTEKIRFSKTGRAVITKKNSVAHSNNQLSRSASRGGGGGGMGGQFSSAASFAPTASGTSLGGGMEMGMG